MRMLANHVKCRLTFLILSFSQLHAAEFLMRFLFKGDISSKYHVKEKDVIRSYEEILFYC